MNGNEFRIGVVTIMMMMMAMINKNIEHMSIQFSIQHCIQSADCHCIARIKENSSNTTTITNKQRNKNTKRDEDCNKKKRKQMPKMSENVSGKERQATKE